MQRRVYATDLPGKPDLGRRYPRVHLRLLCDNRSLLSAMCARRPTRLRDKHPALAMRRHRDVADLARVLSGQGMRWRRQLSQVEWTVLHKCKRVCERRMYHVLYRRRWRRLRRIVSDILRNLTATRVRVVVARHRLLRFRCKRTSGSGRVLHDDTHRMRRI